MNNLYVFLDFNILLLYCLHVHVYGGELVILTDIHVHLYSS
jgi:hypothetical protein